MIGLLKRNAIIGVPGGKKGFILKFISHRVFNDRFTET